MKTLLESFNSFLSEEKGDNLKIAIQAIENEGYEYEIIRRGNTIRVLDDNRVDVMDKMAQVLQPFGYVHQSDGSKLGRLQLVDRQDGSVYILFKLKSRSSPATAGVDFEEALAELLRAVGLNAKTAGPGHGSDLTITGANGELRIEVKTALSADFGQFRAQYNPASRSWEPRRTLGFEKNEDVFGPLFDNLLLPYLNENCLLPLGDERLTQDKNDKIVGIKPSPTTGEFKRKLQAEWFNKKNDYKVDFDFAAIANYYAEKGDQYIQIKRKGLYALNDEAAKRLGVPLFSDSGLRAYVRFRIKPHMGENGTHSFTVAIKLKGRLEPSNKSLLNPADIEEIKNVLS